MKWSDVRPQKLRIAGLLFLLMLIMVCAALNTKFVVQKMDRLLTSVYQDRLQPAVDLVYLNENLYARRLLMETYLAGQSTLSKPALQAQLDQTTADNYRRIGQFEKTVLTDAEAYRLSRFKASLTLSVDLERSILRLTESGQRERATYLFRQPGLTLFQRDTQMLHELVRIQSQTGQEAVREAHREAAIGGGLNLTLLVIVSVGLGLIAWPFLRGKITREQPWIRSV